MSVTALWGGARGGGRWVVESTVAVSQGPRPIGLAKPVWEDGQAKCFGPQGELTTACQRSPLAGKR